MKKLLVSLMLAILSLVQFETQAIANSTPNSFITRGQSWVNVANSERIYLENFGGANRDDAVLRYVEPGVSCTSNSVNATGPFLTPIDLSNSNCTKLGSAFDPINDSTRLGSLPIGFSINFFGANYDSLWPSTNGGVYFGSPMTQYEASLPNLAYNAQSSVMFMLGADQVYRSGKSNLWMAQTTVNSKQAFVLSWENFDTWGNANEKFSYQLVLLNLGSGNFDAWFNYDSLANFDPQFGYNSPYFLVDAKNDVDLANDILTGTYSNDLPTSCTRAWYNRLGTLTSNPLSGGGTFYFKSESVANKTFSLWTDSNCTSSKINFTALQDEATNGKAFFEIYKYNNDKSLAIGWTTYNQTTKEIKTTELVSDATADQLIDGGTKEIINKSLNTNVPGRFIIGQRSGVTTMNVESDVVSNQSTSSSTDSNACNGGLISRIQFREDSATLDRQEKDKIATLKKSFELSGCKNIKILGFTSQTVSNPTALNLQVRAELSSKRAISVQNYLTKTLGISAFYVNEGRSHLEPIASNNSESTRKLNRRAEIWFY